MELNGPSNIEYSHQKIIEAAATLKQALLDAPDKDALLNVLKKTLDPTSSWDNKSTAPYFKERYGLFVRDILDLMAAQPNEDRILLKSSFRNLTKVSISLLINQGWLWLRKNADPDGKYSQLRQQIEVQTVSNGVRLTWKKDSITKKDLSQDINEISIPVAKKADSIKWKDDLTEFLEKAEENQVFDEKRLHLEDEDLAWIKQMIESSEGFYLIDLTSSRVKIIFNSNIGKGK